MTKENELTMEQAHALVAAPSFDPYGRTRLYGTYGPDSAYAGQIAGVKSAYQLDQLQAEGFGRLYVVENNGSVPIRRAGGSKP